MPIRFAALIVLVVVIAVGGCGPREPGPLPTSPDRLIVYSLYGDEGDLPVPPDGAERIYNYPVFGGVEVADAARRAEVIAVVGSDIRPVARDENGSMKSLPACFWPRHAIRLIDGDRVIDVLICYQCSRVETHEGTRQRTELIRGASRDVLDRLLTDAGVQLAKRPSTESAGLEDWTRPPKPGP